MYDVETSDFLRRFGVGKTYRGYDYCLYSVTLILREPQNLDYITKNVYPEVARKFKTNCGCVERNIRTVAEVVWRNGGAEYFFEVTGKQVPKRPPNTKFLEMLAYYVAAGRGRTETVPDACKTCETVSELNERIGELEEEICRLGKTEQWMHDLIWRLIQEVHNS